MSNLGKVESGATEKADIVPKDMPDGKNYGEMKGEHEYDSGVSRRVSSSKKKGE